MGFCQHLLMMNSSKGFGMPPGTGLPRVAANSFAAIVHAYLASPKFSGYAPSTQKLWGAELRYVAAHDRMGSVLIREIRPSIVQACLDGLIERPAKQETVYRALRQLERWAIVRDLLPRLITTGCEIEGLDGGHTPWTDAQVALGEATVSPALSKVISLAANTGQRGSDLIRMRWTDIESFEGHLGINVLQQKTKERIWVPFPRELIAILSGWERRPGFILERPSGGPWVSRNALTWAWWAERQRHPELSDLCLHGLRCTACVRLLRAGNNTRQISDRIGMSEKMVKRYTRFSEQQQNAVAALRQIEGNTLATVIPFGQKTTPQK
jgi:integrase